MNPGGGGYTGQRPMPLHSGLGDTVRLCLIKKKKKKSHVNVCVAIPFSLFKRNFVLSLVNNNDLPMGCVCVCVCWTHHRSASQTLDSDRTLPPSLLIHADFHVGIAPLHRDPASQRWNAGGVLWGERRMEELVWLPSNPRCPWR